MLDVMKRIAPHVKVENKDGNAVSMLEAAKLGDGEFDHVAYIKLTDNLVTTTLEEIYTENGVILEARRLFRAKIAERRFMR